MSGTSDHVVEALAHLNRYASSKQGTKQALSIAVSRQAGSRGAEIARAAGQQLGWDVYDHELLTRIAGETGLHARLLERLDERYINWLESVLNSFSAQSTPAEGPYLKHLLELLASLSKAGHCVIVGRGAPHILPPETTLRVRVVAPKTTRVTNVEQSRHLSGAEAERWVDQTDAERDRFIWKHFRRDPTEPANYDLVLNSGRYSVAECAALIVQAAKVMEAHLPAK